MSSGRACSMMWIGHYGFDSGDGRIVAFGQERTFAMGGWLIDLVLEIHSEDVSRPVRNLALSIRAT
jgi:hypothetical protein